MDIFSYVFLICTLGFALYGSDSFYISDCVFDGDKAEVSF